MKQRGTTTQCDSVLHHIMQGVTINSSPLLIPVVIVTESLEICHQLLPCPPLPTHALHQPIHTHTILNLFSHSPQSTPHTTFNPLLTQPSTYSSRSPQPTPHAASTQPTPHTALNLPPSKPSDHSPHELFTTWQAESIRLNFAPSRLRSEFKSRFEPIFCRYGFHNIILTPPSQRAPYRPAKIFIHFPTIYFGFFTF